VLKETITHAALGFTGERMVPEAAQSATFWEHVYRYRFAVPFATGKRVLDVACGEGYGAAALSRHGAASVVGVDISPETCAHARSKYGVDVRCGDATHLPFQDGSFDVVVSFETIEHLSDPAAFLRECSRVLTAGGRLVLSTPNGPVYRQHCPDNPYHCAEMTLREFTATVSTVFPAYVAYGQILKGTPWWLPAEPCGFWASKRGWGRLYRMVARRLAPAAWHPLRPSCRDSVVDLIGGSDSSLAAHFVPWRVRAVSPARIQNCVYVVVVAHKA
jgi:2-polyprenyl-3-methyl-5-hydroxy-6-metoxy-1,4-benzoquinol methylase